MNSMWWTIVQLLLLFVDAIVHVYRRFVEPKRVEDIKKARADEAAKRLENFAQLRLDFLADCRRTIQATVAVFHADADPKISRRVNEIVVREWGFGADDEQVALAVAVLRHAVDVAKDVFGERATPDVCLDLYPWLTDAEEDGIRFAVACAREVYGEDASPEVCLSVIDEMFGSDEEEDKR